MPNRLHIPPPITPAPSLTSSPAPRPSPSRQVMSDSAHLKRLKREIHGLRAELQREKQTNRATEVEEMQLALAEESKRNTELQERLRQLVEKLVVSSVPSEKPNVPAK